ncbi:unnamed protein product [Prunus armeniaca]
MENSEMHKGMCKTRFQTVSERMGVSSSSVIKNHMKEKIKSNEPSSTLPHPLSTLPHPKYPPSP